MRGRCLWRLTEVVIVIMIRRIDKQTMIFYARSQGETAPETEQCERCIYMGRLGVVLGWASKCIIVSLGLLEGWDHASRWLYKSMQFNLYMGLRFKGIIWIAKDREILGKDFSMRILRDLKTCFSGIETTFCQKGREMGDTWGISAGSGVCLG